MKKRQIKKFAKNAKRNMIPYRQAFDGTGSKKINRRRKAFGRFGRGRQFFAESQARKRMLAELKDQLHGDPAKSIALVHDLIESWPDVA